MFRNERYFKKNDGQHNYFGQAEITQNKNGTIKLVNNAKEVPPKQKKIVSEQKSE